MTIEKEVIYPGGLMRCCINTLMERTEPASQGEIQHCKHCAAKMVFKGDGWRWDGKS